MIFVAQSNIIEDKQSVGGKYKKNTIMPQVRHSKGRLLPHLSNDTKSAGCLHDRHAIYIFNTQAIRTSELAET